MSRHISSSRYGAGGAAPLEKRIVLVVTRAPRLDGHGRTWRELWTQLDEPPHEVRKRLYALRHKGFVSFDRRERSLRPGWRVCERERGNR
jgi:hypothetical protein